jgi:hypothetical protein
LRKLLDKLHCGCGRIFRVIFKNGSSRKLWGLTTRCVMKLRYISMTIIPGRPTHRSRPRERKRFSEEDRPFMRFQENVFSSHKASLWPGELRQLHRLLEPSIPVCPSVFNRNTPSPLATLD